jgi:hypothetical protein
VGFDQFPLGVRKFVSSHDADLHVSPPGLQPGAYLGDRQTNEFSDRA